VGRIILTDACVAEGADWLCRKEPRFAAVLSRCQPLPLRRTTDGFDRVLHAIVGQQVSIASANAIWSRLEGAGMTDPHRVAQTSDEDLRALGLSRQKARYAKALAASGIDYDALRLTPTAEVISTLVEVPGIGPWTAEIYAMFALGRADVFAPGDLALQEAARDLFTMDQRPTEKVLRTMAEEWAPWRSVAARILWAYYRVIKSREGIA
jgi:DNA-3-methyladenine glycosylase II